MPDTILNSGWTVETLKESVDQRFADNQKAVETALVGQEKAVTAAFLAAKEVVSKGEIATEKRFDAVTKSITELANKTGELVPRTEYAANHKALDDKIVVATDAINRSSGDKNLYATNTFVTQTVNQAIGSLETKMEAILTPLVSYVSAQKGVTQGSQTTKTGLISAITVTATIVALLGVLFNLVT